MNIKLALCTREQIQAFLQTGKLSVPFEMLEGALPPFQVLKEAERSINDGTEPFWIAPWLYVLETEGLAIGSGGFKGAPVKGRVEVGFGIVQSYRGRGYATSGLKLLLRTAFERPEITEVIAETALNNIPSRRVVEKTGFEHVGQRDTIEDGKVDIWCVTLKENTGE